MTSAYGLLLENVHARRRSWQIRRAIEGLVLLLAAAAAQLISRKMTLDSVVDFDNAGRWCLFVAFWAVMVAVIARVHQVRPLAPPATAMIISRRCSNRHTPPSATA